MAREKRLIPTSSADQHQNSEEIMPIFLRCVNLREKFGAVKIVNED